METPRKISSSPSSRNERGKDMISKLPDDLIHQIFSYMDMQQVIQTSVLSKRWKSLWMTNPHINIKCTGKEKHSSSTFSYTDFVYRLLLNHDDASSVLKRGVKVLELESTKLEHWALQSFSSFHNLKSLRLDYVSFTQNLDSDEIFLNTPSLEKLVLKDCDYKYYRMFHILAPNLNHLELYQSRSSTFCHVRVNAINLREIHVKGGRMFDDYLFENLSNLENAEIDFHPFPVGETLDRRLTNVLTGILNVTSLVLSASVFQEFRRVPNRLNAMPVFGNLKHLKLTKWCSNVGSICVIARLLEKSPNVETLVVERTDQVEGIIGQRGRWREQLSSPCSLSHLKSVVIKNLAARDNELKFLEFLLKSALCLENLVMTTTAPRRQRLLAYRRKLLRSSFMASRDVKLDVLS